MKVRQLESCKRVYSYSVRRQASSRTGAAEHKASVVVTRNNFRGLLGSILQYIHDADFLAIDTTLTGTLSTPWHTIHALDTPETTYHKLKHSAERFTLLEFGLCTFTWREPDQKFVARPYSFYLFPQGDFKIKLESESFLCEIAALKCLTKQGFDFNTCFRQGISYMSKDQESMAGVKMDFEAKNSSGMRMLGNFRFQHKNNYLEMTSADKMYSHHIRTKLTQWRSSLKSKNIASYHYETIQESGVAADMDVCSKKGTAQQEISLFGRKDQNVTRLIDSSVIWYKSCEHPRLVRASMKLDSLGHRELLVLLEVIRVDFDDLVAVVQPESLASPNQNVHVFLAASHKEKIDLLEELEQSEIKEKERKLADSIGFRHIIDAMVMSKKPIIGHHCLLDFAHIYKTFLKPLPMTIAKFTAGLQENFPCIIDTKYVLQSIPQLEIDKDTPLHALFLKLYGSQSDENGGVILQSSDLNKANKNSALNERVRPKQGKELSKGSGTNAYFAGCVFAYLCDLTNTHPCELKKLTVPSREMDIRRHMNLLCMSDTPSTLDLSTGCLLSKSTSSQKQLDRSNVVLIWGYPYGMSQTSLQMAVNKAPGASHPVDVILLDDSSALLQFDCFQAAEQFLVVLQRLTKGSRDLETPSWLGGGVRAARFAAYEYLCKYSPPSLQTLADCARHLQVGLSGL